jgi:hypothetical protein
VDLTHLGGFAAEQKIIVFVPFERSAAEQSV